MKRDNRAPIVRACIICVGIVLVLSAAFVFLAFRTDYIFNINADKTLSASNFERTSVTTIIEEIDSLEAGSGSRIEPPVIEDETPEGVTGDPDGWYEDIPADTPAGSLTGTLGNYNLYNGIPWKADSNTYIYYSYKAKEDIYTLFKEAAGIEKATSGAEVVDSASSALPAQGVTLDGIACMGVCSIPAALDKEYYPDSCFKSATASCDSISANGKIRMAVVLVPEGGDLSDTSSYVYLPATKIDAKAHTFYGGVVQTNVKLVAENTVQVGTNWSGSKYVETTVNPSDIKKTIADVNKIMGDNSTVGKINMSSWALNNIETYNLGDVADTLSSNYDVVGFVVWHGDFDKL